MNTLVAIKRVPETGARIRITSDGQAVDDAALGHTISPHEECAVEEAIRIATATGGTATVLALGPAEVVEQLRASMAMGVDEAIALVTPPNADWGPSATAQAIADAVASRLDALDVLLFGHESADNGNQQVAIRVAQLLSLPFAVGIKSLTIAENGEIEAAREARGGMDVFGLRAPAVVAVKEGINLPRHASVRGRLRSAKAAIATTEVAAEAEALTKVALRLPPAVAKPTEYLDGGSAAVPRIVEILEELGFVA